MKKKSLTQEILEAQVIHKHKGKRIDLKELWDEIEKDELDPKFVADLTEKK